MYLGIFLALSMLLVCSVYNEARSIYYPVTVCGQKQYDTQGQICCEDQVYNKKKRSETCCGYKVFDADLMKCCKKTNGDWVIRKNDSCTDELPKISR